VSNWRILILPTTSNTYQGRLGDLNHSRANLNESRELGNQLTPVGDGVPDLELPGVLGLNLPRSHTMPYTLPFRYSSGSSGSWPYSNWDDHGKQLGIAWLGKVHVG
jgi:hypothetical protein